MGGICRMITQYYDVSTKETNEFQCGQNKGKVEVAITEFKRLLPLKRLQPS